TYLNSAAPFRILVWSAVFVILRGSCRHALNAAGKQTLDLRCAIISAGLNVSLNLLLIPQYGMIGSATATVIADVVWFVMAGYFFNRAVLPLRLLQILSRPLVAGATMALAFEVVSSPGDFRFVFLNFFVEHAETSTWQMFAPLLRGALATTAYFATLLLLGEPGVLGFFKKDRTT
ncbi:MAG: polysaccharide biosynthesis C-terminal domain-containing protein, partial [Acidobacteria bacterium]|nr:polysaccharide biosynthesis C-terminal domain-containing protein [Acidobacteriota bacterium]